MKWFVSQAWGVVRWMDGEMGAFEVYGNVID